MHKISIGIILLTLLKTICYSQLDHEEKNIYIVALKNLYNKDTPKRIVIRQNIELTPFCEIHSKRALKGQDKKNEIIPLIAKDSSWFLLLDHFDTISLEKKKIIGEFESELNISIISKNKISRIFKSSKHEKNWRRFFRKYRGAIDLGAFSKIAYSYNLSKAILYYNTLSSPLNGKGYLFLLQKVKDEWKVFVRVQISGYNKDREIYLM